MISAGQAEIKAAGLCAKTAVSASSTDHGGKIAAAGNAHAKRTVNEGFRLNIHGADDGFDLFQRKLTGKHKAIIAHILQELCAACVMHHGLGGCMQCNGRASVAKKLQHRHILNL